MMENLIRKFEENTNLKSYSSSIGFEGFFYRKGKHSLSKVDNAINFFQKFWRSTIDDTLILGSTLKIDSPLESLINDCNYKTSDIVDYINPLINKKIIKIGGMLVNGDTLNSGDENEAGANFLYQEVKFESANLIKKVLFVIMALGGVYGHLFILFEKSNLIVYPHDDIGFGAISITKNNRVVESFFDQVNKEIFLLERK